jgi:putative aminopeptidase
VSLINDVIRYSDLWGPSGAEDEVIRAFVDDLDQLGFDSTVDTFGNVTTTLHRAEAGFPTIALTAHLDEVGFVVRKIEADGFLRLHRVGGTHDRVVAGQRIRLRTEHEDVIGAIGIKAKHVSTQEELRTALTTDDAYVDVLAADRDEAESLGLEVGTLAAFETKAEANATFVRGKAMDNRAGIAILLEVARSIANAELGAGVILLATVQEEFSVRGGVPAMRRIKPDLALCIDIAIATDTPDLTSLGDVRLGAGPVITRFTRANLNGIIPNPKLVRLLRDTARQAKVSTQYGVLQGGLTDGSFMQLEGAGIPTLDLSFPTRYTHTPIETCHIGDLQAVADLATAVATKLPRDLDLGRG